MTLAVMGLLEYHSGILRPLTGVLNDYRGKRGFWKELKNGDPTDSEILSNLISEIDSHFN